MNKKYLKLSILMSILNFTEYVLKISSYIYDLPNNYIQNISTGNKRSKLTKISSVYYTLLSVMLQ